MKNMDIYIYIHIYRYLYVYNNNKSKKEDMNLKDIKESCMGGLRERKGKWEAM